MKASMVKLENLSKLFGKVVAVDNISLDIHHHQVFAALHGGNGCREMGVVGSRYRHRVDLVVVARLMRRDIIGVGKREIRDIPVVGRVMEAAGVILIDRRNSASAIEAMKQLANTMRIEGKSVCLSPEGTRAVTPKLAEFKKGAFHLAIQAGVPVVPIVIHNSNDVQPKGDFIFHPGTVNVEVLPPIDTGNWSASTIDVHVAEVRNLYLQVLDQKKTMEKV